MVENRSFNLEKIKEITNPIDELHGKIHSLEEFYVNFIESQNKISQTHTEHIFVEYIQEITQKLNYIYEKLIKISNENLYNFLIFKDILIKIYKDSFKEKIKSLNLDQSYFTYGIGLFLIKNKKINKIIEQSSFIFSLTSNQWSDLSSSLKQNSIFLSTIKKVRRYFNTLEIELEKVPKDFEPILEKDYKKEQQFEHFKYSEVEYFKYTTEEYQRRKRRERREKLKDIQKKPIKEVEIDEDIFEKIEKFKSKTSFEEKYLIQKDDETDPLKLIRDRKKEKEEEYKDFIEKFKKESK